MKHEQYFDEENKVVVLRIKEEFNLEEAAETVKKMEQLTKCKESILVLTGITSAPPKLDREVREVLKNLPQEMNITKTALILTNPAVRMASRIIVSAMGNSDNANFFKTEKEALRWPRGE